MLPQQPQQAVSPQAEHDGKQRSKQKTSRRRRKLPPTWPPRSTCADGASGSPLFSLEGMYRTLQEAIAEPDDGLQMLPTGGAFSSKQLQSLQVALQAASRHGTKPMVPTRQSVHSTAGSPLPLSRPQQATAQQVPLLPGFLDDQRQPHTQAVHAQQAGATFITQACMAMGDEEDIPRRVPTATAGSCVNAASSRRLKTGYSTMTGITGKSAANTCGARGGEANKTAGTQIRLVPHAPNTPPACRAVHPLFLAGVLLHGLPSSPSPMLTGERQHRWMQQGVRSHDNNNCQNYGWTTQDLVSQCIRPSLGPTRIAYTQAVACGAVHVTFAPGGRFTAGLEPAPAISQTSQSPRFQANPTQHAGPDLPAQQQPAGVGKTVRISLSDRAGGLLTDDTDAIRPHSAVKDTASWSRIHSVVAHTAGVPTSHSDGDGCDDQSMELVLPDDLEGRPAFGPITYYVAHAWQGSWTDLVVATLQHYAQLPEVVAAGAGTKFVPVYYWLDVFAVPQFERPCPEFKRPQQVLRQVVGAASCKALLMMAKPWSRPLALTRAWCLYEMHLARQLGVPMQLLLQEELPGNTPSPALTLQQMLGQQEAASHSWSNSCMAGAQCHADEQAGCHQVVAVVDSALETLDVASTTTRNPADMTVIIDLIKEEFEGIPAFNHSCRSFLRPHWLASLLTAVLRSGQAGMWDAAASLIAAGAFLQWPSPLFVVESTAECTLDTLDTTSTHAAADAQPSSADAAAAFLGAALRTCAPAPTTGSVAHHLTGSNPLQELVFLSPSAPAIPTTATSSASISTSATMSASRAQPLARNAGGTAVELSRPGSCNNSPRCYADSGLLCMLNKASSRQGSPRIAAHPDDAISRGLRRLQQKQQQQQQRMLQPGQDAGHAAGAAKARGTSIYTAGLTVAGLTALSDGLVGNRCLTKLVISGHSVGCAGTQALVDALSAQPTALSCLLMRGCGIGPLGGAALGNLLGSAPMCSLTELDVADNPDLGQQGVEALSRGVAVNPHLRRLHLHGCQAGSEATSTLAHAMVQQLSAMPYQAVGSYKAARTISPRPTVRHTHGNDYPAAVPLALHTPAGLVNATAITGSLQPGLQYLDLQGNGIAVEAADALAMLISHRRCQLVQLKLGHNLLETQGVLTIARALQANSSLQVLQLRDNQLALEVGAALATALCGKALHAELLPGSPCAPADDAAQVAGAVPQWVLPHNGQHSCGNSPRRPRSGAGSARASPRTCAPAHSGACRLLSLDLGENPLLGDVGVSLLAQGILQAQGRMSLEELLLDGVGCGVQGACAIAGALAAPATYGGSSTAAATAAAQQGAAVTYDVPMVALAGLTRLDLSGNAIKHDGAMALAAAIPHSKRLASLVLHDCKIDVEGRLALLTALQLSTASPLRHLDVSCNCQDPATYIPPALKQCEGALKVAAGCRQGQIENSTAAPSEFSLFGTDPLEGGSSKLLGLTKQDAQQGSCTLFAGLDLAKYESILAQSLTMSRQLQNTRVHMHIEL